MAVNLRGVAYNADTGKLEFYDAPNFRWETLVLSQLPTSVDEKEGHVVFIAVKDEQTF